MKLSIRQYGDPILRTKGEKITSIDERIRTLASDMIETMHEANGVGLAAQQVGQALQLIVIDVSGADDRPSTIKVKGLQRSILEHMPLVLANPEIMFGVDTDVGVEGCLSIADITAEVERASLVSVRAQGLDEGWIEFEATGLLARALQHEVDHLNGILFTDRVNSAARLSISRQLKRLRENAVTAQK